MPRNRMENVKIRNIDRLGDVELKIKISGHGGEIVHTVEQGALVPEDPELYEMGLMGNLPLAWLEKAVICDFNEDPIDNIRLYYVASDWFMVGVRFVGDGYFDPDLDGLIERVTKLFHKNCDSWIF